MKAMATVGGLTGVSRVVGFVRDVMTAAILGAGPLADAFFVALKIPNFFRHVTAEGAFSVSFIPLYSATLQKDGEKAAGIFAGQALSFMFLILSLFSIAAMAAMPWVIDAIAPGFDKTSEQYSAAVEMTRITFPYLLLMSLAALLGGILNAHEKFAPFSAAPIFFNLCQIIALLCAVWFKTPGHALSWGIAASGVVQVLWLVWFVRRNGIYLPIIRPRMTPTMKRLFKKMAPGAVGAGIIHINLFVDMIIASFLASGAISALYYADRLFQLPLGIVGIAVGTALLPMLTKALVADDRTEAKDLFNRSLEYGLILTVPAAVALVTIPDEIIKVLFERGEFTHEDTLRTSPTLLCLAIGLPAFVAVKIFSSAYWARHDTMTPVKIAVAMAMVNIVAAIILTRYMDVAGIALATGVSGWIQCYFLWRGLRRDEALAFDERFKKAALKTVACSVIMAAFLVVTASFLAGWFADESTLPRLIALGILVAGGGMLYFASAQVSGLVRLQDMRHYIRRRK